MNNGKNKGLKGILIPKETHKRLIVTKGQKGLKTVGSTIEDLIESDKELEDVKESEQNQIELTLSIRKKFERMCWDVAILFEFMKTKGIHEIPEEIFDEIPLELNNIANEKGVYFVKAKKEEAQRIPDEEGLE